MAERARRLGLGDADVLILSEPCVERILAEVARVNPRTVIVDSISTVYLDNVDSSAGRPNQARGCARTDTRAGMTILAILVLFSSWKLPL